MTETADSPVAETISVRRRRNLRAIAVAVALLPAWSISFAESGAGFALTMITTAAVLLVLLRLDRQAFDAVRARSAAVILYVVLAGAAIVSFVFHPSIVGAVLTFAIVTPVGVALSVSGLSIDELRRFVALPLLATSAIQAVLVAIQSATGSPIGISILHPGVPLLVTNDTIVRPQGMFDHVYEPALVALIAVAIGLALLPPPGRLRTWFIVLMGTATTSIALTHSRAALLGIILVVVVAAIASIRSLPELRLPTAVVVLAFIIPALLSFSAWQTRFDESVASDLDDASLGRVTLAKQAMELAVDHPIVGVGPNRYFDVLEAEYTVDEDYPFVVHSVPLMLAAELGIPAAIAFTLLLAWAGIQAIQAGYRSVLLYVAPLPFVVFDVLLYNKPVGLLLLAVWCGVMGALRAASPSRALGSTV